MQQRKILVFVVIAMNLVGVASGVRNCSSRLSRKMLSVKGPTLQQQVERRVGVIEFATRDVVSLPFFLSMLARGNFAPQGSECKVEELAVRKVIFFTGFVSAEKVRVLRDVRFDRAGEVVVGEVVSDADEVIAVNQLGCVSDFTVFSREELHKKMK